MVSDIGRETDNGRETGGRSAAALDRPGVAPEDSGYHIVLPLGASLDRNLETLDSLLRHAASPADLRVVGDRLALSAVRERRPQLQAEVVEAETSAALTWLPGLLRSAPDRDILVVSPGILAVPLFDLRLAWSAHSSPEVAAVSPLCDVDPLGSLGRFQLSTDDPVELDRLVSSVQAPGIVDAPYLLPECFYLRCRCCDGLPESAFAEPRALLAALKRRGFVIGLAPHVVVGSSLPRRQEPGLGSEAARCFLAESPLKEVAARAVHTAETGFSPVAVRRRVRPRILHVAHSLGGGLERWVRLFASVGDGPESWVLRSVGERGRFGSQLWLFDDPRATRPRRTWKLANPIAATALHHLDYRRALDDIVTDLGVDAVVVSSLIGHSLDALRTGVKTAFVCHDYYPFCPALHIHFDGVCESCLADRLQRCRDENPIVDLFESREAEDWLALREAFFAAVEEHGVHLVAPSRSVERNYRRLAPRLASVPFAFIEHGADTAGLLALRAQRQGRAGRGGEGPLRAMVLGRLSEVKGQDLLARVAEQVRADVEFFLIGCGDQWNGSSPHGAAVIRHYEASDLPEIIGRIDPDVALFLSIAPETYSFTLTECSAAGVPPLATRVGSFEDRIVDGVTGFLAEPSAAAFAERLLALAADRSKLAEVERNLAAVPRRTEAEMVADYTRLLGLATWSRRSYFSPVVGAGGVGGSADDDLLEAWLPPSSALGFRDFFRQVERGVRYHIQSSRRLRPWQRRSAKALANLGFRVARSLMRFV